jgi:transcriptional regulator with XRE-family HTH domain
MLTSEQLRAARAMLKIEQRQLADAAGVSLETIKRIERGKGPVSVLSGTLDKLTRTLDAAGVILIEENGDGPGIRLRKAQGSDGLAPDKLNASNDE